MCKIFVNYIIFRFVGFGTKYRPSPEAQPPRSSGARVESYVRENISSKSYSQVYNSPL